MEESWDVMINVSSPHNSFDSSLEVVVGEDEITRHSSGGAAWSHSKTNISSLKSINIGDTFTSDSNLIAQKLKSKYEIVLILSSRSAENLKVLYDFLKLFFILKVVLWFLGQWVELLDDGTSSSSKLLSSHNSEGIIINILLWDNLCFDGNFLCSL